MPTIAIQAKDLRKNYGAFEALRGLNFAIPEGEIVAFLGPNSAGKSTTLKILAGLMPGSSGEAYIQGVPLASQAAKVRRHIGYMPENNPLPEDCTVRDYLIFRAQLKGLSRAAAKARTTYLADLCDLSGRPMRRPIGVLSRGVRQRVGIAEALLGSPSVLLLDEPTIGLDPYQVVALRELIMSMRGEHTILVSTHILSEAEAIADRVLIINKGEQVAFGSPEQLRQTYQAQERWAFELGKDVLEKFLPGAQGKLCSKQSNKNHWHYEVVFPSADLAQLLAAKLMREIPGVLFSFNRIVPNLESIFMAATSKRKTK